METRSRKRKQLSLPTNPYARAYLKRRRSFPNPTARVKDLRTRRVFSPASASDVKEEDKEETGPKVGFFDLGVNQNGEKSSEEDESPQTAEIVGEIGGKVGFLDVGLAQKDELVQTTPCDGENVGFLGLGVSQNEDLTQTQGSDGEIVGEIEGKIGNLDLGVGEKSEIGEKEEALNLGFGVKDGGDGEEDELVQSTPLDSELKQNGEKEVKEERVLQRDGFGVEGEREEQQPKPKLKQGGSGRYRSRLYKNPGNFSYKRLLPFLMDLTKDDSDAPIVYPIRKLEKSEEERLSPSLPSSREVLIDEVNKEIGTNQQPSSVESSVMNSPDEPLIESTTPKTPNTPAQQVHLSDKTSSETPETIPPVKSSCSPANLESSSMIEGGGLDKACQGNNGNGKTESYNDESFQSTPPDSDVFGKPGLSVSKDCALESSLKPRTVYDKNKSADESEKDKHSIMNAKLGVLIPCSRKKLYRTPGSFSYRRLLPYLTNLAKNDTYTIGISPSQNVDKAMNEGNASSFVDSQEILKDGANKGVLSSEIAVGDSDTPNLESTQMTPPVGTSSVSLPELKATEEKSVEAVTLDANVESIIQETNENTVVSEVGSDISKPSNVDVESELQLSQDVLDKVDNVEPTHQTPRITNETSAPIKSSPPPLIPTQGPSLLPRTEDNGSFLMLKSSTDANSTMELSMQQETPNKQSPVPLEISTPGSSTGILKRHPRGCRGVCNCLNCASFRLHAERAFEFSKNQMLDTEEVTLGLVKELSEIRTMLENSNNSGEQNALQVPQLQAQEICMKASRAEENAKSYLKQMSEDLNNHCRTPLLGRPRVRFANRLEM